MRYVRDEEGWGRDGDVTWRGRATDDGDEARAERDAFLEEHGWLASTVRRGRPGEMEYRLRASSFAKEKTPRLVIAQVDPLEPAPVRFWPATAAAGAVERVLLTGPFPERAALAPESWGTLVLSDASLEELVAKEADEKQ